MTYVKARLPYVKLAAFCRAHHIKRMWAFGSVLRDDYAESSDVDLLVEFEAEYVPGLEFFGWQEELAALIGRPVDLGTPSSLSRHIRQRVLSSAEVIYERSAP